MRATIFIDYQNTYMLARRYFSNYGSMPSSFGQFYPTLLAQKIKNQNSEISEINEVRIYRGLPSASFDKRGHKSAMNQMNSWVTDPKVKVITRPLSYKKIISSGMEKQIMMEKGIDVSLAIDFVTQAILGKYDLGIIFSSDTDLKPALEFVNSDAVGAYGHVAAWRPDKGKFPRLATGKNQPYCYWLYSKDFYEIADFSKY